MPEADTLRQRVLEAQNSDGGWGYQNASSWTEPTALALLALDARGATDVARHRGLEWLVRTQRSDGGWAPQPSVDQSTSVTSLATLALSDSSSTAPNVSHGIMWLIAQIQPAETSFERSISHMRGILEDIRPAGGSPWFPGTAAWIAPTAISTIALSREASENNNAALRTYVSRSQQFILSRRCRDGGWNHGGGKYRSENANSYPEMTGMALLALCGADPSALMFSLARAEEFVQSPTSLEALSWLQLGLLAHGRDYRDMKTELPCRTVRDISLRLLASAPDANRNKLLMRS